MKKKQSNVLKLKGEYTFTVNKINGELILYNPINRETVLSPPLLILNTLTELI